MSCLFSVNESMTMPDGRQFCSVRSATEPDGRVVYNVYDMLWNTGKYKDVGTISKAWKRLENSKHGKEIMGLYIKLTSQGQGQRPIPYMDSAGFERLFSLQHKRRPVEDVEKQQEVKKKCSLQRTDVRSVQQRFLSAYVNSDFGIDHLTVKHLHATYTDFCQREQVWKTMDRSDRQLDVFINQLHERFHIPLPKKKRSVIDKTKVKEFLIQTDAYEADLIMPLTKRKKED